MPEDPPGSTAQLGSLLRPGGARQLTIDGFPAYTFTGDTAPGAMSGEGLRLGSGVFWAVTPSGAALMPPPPPPPPVATPRRTIPAPPVRAHPPAPIPQGNGGDHDGDNRGGANDGDGDV